MWKQFLIAAVILVSCAACQQTPEPITFGKDQCKFCKMTISDPKFGAELVTDKGRLFKYDAVECLINDLEANTPNYSGLYAIAYDQPQKLVLVDSLFFVTSLEYKSPMGANLAAFKDLNNTNGESAQKWKDLLENFNQ